MQSSVFLTTLCSMTKTATSHIAPFGLRMQPELKQKLEDSARANNRSMNAELVARLEASFVTHEGMNTELHALFFDLLKQTEARLMQKIEDAKKGD